MIRPEWIPAAYLEDEKAGAKAEFKKASGKTTLYTDKSRLSKNSFKRKVIK